MITVLLAFSVWLNLILAINLYDYYRLKETERAAYQKKVIDLILQKDGL
jgi:hypothetical protein